MIDIKINSFSNNAKDKSFANTSKFSYNSAGCSFQFEVGTAENTGTWLLDQIRSCETESNGIVTAERESRISPRLTWVRSGLARRAIRFVAFFRAAVTDLG